jgi:hypothetical protein
VILKKFNKLKEEQSGSAIILVSLSLIVLLAITGIVIDGGRLFMTKSSMQKAANAAVLSGAQELTANEADVTQIVQEVLQAHSEDSSLQTLNIQMEQKKVSVDLKRDVPLAFSKLFGIDTAPVEVHAAAKIGTMGKAVGVAPLGIDESIPLEFYKKYQLKVDQTEADTGYFGILGLGGTGSKTYEYNLRYGYENPLEIGDRLLTETGNVAGKTSSVVDELITACPITGDPLDVDRDCERILLIPVYKPIHYNSGGQLQEVEITGFAYFLITDQLATNGPDKSITGMFIEKTGTGFEGSTATNNGAYSIRLTE